MGVLVGVFVGVLVGVSVGVLVGVSVGVLVGVFVAVAVAVLVGVFVGVLVGVLVAVLVGVFVGVCVGVFGGVFVGVLVGVFVGVLVGVSVAVGVGVGRSFRMVNPLSAKTWLRPSWFATARFWTTLPSEPDGTSAVTTIVNDPEAPPVGVQDPETTLPEAPAEQPVTFEVLVTEAPVTTSGPGTVSLTVMTEVGFPAPKLTIRLNDMLSP